jgi:hypothetical protein
MDGPVLESAVLAAADSPVVRAMTPCYLFLRHGKWNSLCETGGSIVLPHRKTLTLGGGRVDNVSVSLPGRRAALKLLLAADTDGKRAPRMSRSSQNKAAAPAHPAGAAP